MLARTVGYQITALDDEIKRRHIRQTAHGAHGVFLLLSGFFAFLAGKVHIGKHAEYDVVFARLCFNDSFDALRLAQTVVGQQLGQPDGGADRCGVHFGEVLLYHRGVVDIDLAVLVAVRQHSLRVRQVGQFRQCGLCNGDVVNVHRSVAVDVAHQRGVGVFL